MRDTAPSEEVKELPKEEINISGASKNVQVGDDLNLPTEIKKREPTRSFSQNRHSQYATRNTSFSSSLRTRTFSSHSIKAEPGKEDVLYESPKDLVGVDFSNKLKEIARRKSQNARKYMIDQNSSGRRTKVEDINDAPASNEDSDCTEKEDDVKKPVGRKESHALPSSLISVFENKKSSSEETLQKSPSKNSRTWKYKLKGKTSAKNEDSIKEPEKGEEGEASTHKSLFPDDHLVIIDKETQEQNEQNRELYEEEIKKEEKEDFDYNSKEIESKEINVKKKEGEKVGNEKEVVGESEISLKSKEIGETNENDVEDGIKEEKEKKKTEGSSEENEGTKDSMQEVKNDEEEELEGGISLALLEEKKKQDELDEFMRSERELNQPFPGRIQLPKDGLEILTIEKLVAQQGTDETKEENNDSHTATSTSNVISQNMPFSDGQSDPEYESGNDSNTEGDGSEEEEEEEDDDTSDIFRQIQALVIKQEKEQQEMEQQEKEQPEQPEQQQQYKGCNVESVEYEEGQELGSRISLYSLKPVVSDSNSRVASPSPSAMSEDEKNNVINNFLKLSDSLRKSDKQVVATDTNPENEEDKDKNEDNDVPHKNNDSKKEEVIGNFLKLSNSMKKEKEIEATTATEEPEKIVDQEEIIANVLKLSNSLKKKNEEEANSGHVKRLSKTMLENPLLEGEKSDDNIIQNHVIQEIEKEGNLHQDDTTTTADTNVDIVRTQSVPSNLPTSDAKSQLLLFKEQIRSISAVNLGKTFAENRNNDNDASFNETRRFIKRTKSVKVKRIEKGDSLGFGIIGGNKSSVNGIFVSSVDPNGASVGQMIVGYQILSINDVITENVSLEFALATLKQLQGEIHFEVVFNPLAYELLLKIRLLRRTEGIEQFFAISQFDYNPSTPALSFLSTSLEIHRGDFLFIRDAPDRLWWKATIVAKNEKIESTAIKTIAATEPPQKEGLIPSFNRMTARMMAQDKQVVFNSFAVDVNIAMNSAKQNEKKKVKHFKFKKKKTNKEMTVDIHEASKSSEALSSAFCNWSMSKFTIESDSVLTREDGFSLFYTPVQFQPRRHLIFRPIIMVGLSSNDLMNYMLKTKPLEFFHIIPDTTCPLKPSEINGLDINVLKDTDLRSRLESGDYFHATVKEDGILAYPIEQVLNSQEGKHCIMCNLSLSSLAILARSYVDPVVVVLLEEQVAHSERETLNELYATLVTVVGHLNYIYLSDFNTAVEEVLSIASASFEPHFTSISGNIVATNED